MGWRFPKTKGMSRREAARWLARLQSGRDPAVESKFERWYQAHPAHADAFDRVRRSYEQAGLLRHSPLAARAGPNSIEDQKVSKQFAFAAAIAAILLVPMALIVSHETGAARTMLLVTAVGEIREVHLADGSKITLDTSTDLRIELGPASRRALLNRGRARFRIAPGRTPFAIEAGSARVVSEGGVIDVERVANESRVKVLAGKAQLKPLADSNAAPVPLQAGEATLSGPGGIVQKGPLAQTADWTRGMLQFDGTPLVDAVALANRYSPRTITLIGNLGGQRVTGAFRAGDTEGLARALSATFNLELKTLPDGRLSLSVPVASHRSK